MELIGPDVSIVGKEARWTEDDVCLLAATWNASDGLHRSIRMKRSKTNFLVAMSQRNDAILSLSIPVSLRERGGFCSWHSSLLSAYVSGIVLIPVLVHVMKE
jgi:hypothetical protein